MSFRERLKIIWTDNDLSSKTQLLQLSKGISVSHLLIQESSHQEHESL